MTPYEIASPIVAMAAFAVGIAVGFAAGRYRTHLFQNRGEARVARALRRFASPSYHLLNHVTLPLRKGSTQIDHILVSRFGVFVIETKDHGGWIFASANDRYWTQVFYGNRFKFQNPLHQNHVHLRAVQELLEFLPPNISHSIVVFTGEAKFKTSVPNGVFSLNELIDYLQSRTIEVMPENHVQLCVGRLEIARRSISKETDIEHTQRLRRRFGIDE